MKRCFHAGFLYGAALVLFLTQSACSDGEMINLRTLGHEGDEESQQAALRGSSDAIDVSTTEGIVSGSEKKGIFNFMGIPYAAPPVGDLRWQAPRPALKHVKKLDATKYGHICPQTAEELKGKVIGNEDCLNLNIWTPSLAKKSKLPVMVFIHGGGFAVGFGAFPALNGTEFAKDGAVLVSINYRLGTLGFMALPSLEGVDKSYPTSGNYGQLDQIAALKWVKENIASFGGDPNLVTIFGQSAGGISVCNLVASPKAVGLFHRAIDMSGSCLDRSAQNTRTEGSFLFPESPFAIGEEMADFVGCRSPDPKQERACLLKKTPQDLLGFLIKLSEEDRIGLEKGRLGLGPIIDGDFLPTDTSSLLAGKSEQMPSKVPFMFGVLSGDYKSGMLRNAEKLPLFNDTEYLAYLVEVWGEDFGAKLSKAYPLADFGGDSHVALANITFDHSGACVGLDGIRNYDHTNGEENHVFHYLYDIGEAKHGEEVGPIFGVTRDKFLESLGSEIRKSWIQFAKTGVPGPVNGTQWDASSASAQSFLRITDKDDLPLKTTMESGWIVGSRCDVWLER